MTIIYVDADMEICEPRNHNQRIDLDTWLVGSQPGRTVAGPLNPVLYERPDSSEPG